MFPKIIKFVTVMQVNSVGPPISLAAIFRGFPILVRLKMELIVSITVTAITKVGNFLWTVTLFIMDFFQAINLDRTAIQKMD